MHVDWIRKMPWFVVDGESRLGWLMTTMSVSGWMFLLVPAHPGCPGQIPQSRKMVVCVCVLVTHWGGICIQRRSPVPVLTGLNVRNFFRVTNDVIKLSSAMIPISCASQLPFRHCEAVLIVMWAPSLLLYCYFHNFSNSKHRVSKTEVHVDSVNSVAR